MNTKMFTKMYSKIFAIISNLKYDFYKNYRFTNIKVSKNVYTVVNVNLFVYINVYDV